MTIYLNGETWTKRKEQRFHDTIVLRNKQGSTFEITREEYKEILKAKKEGFLRLIENL